MGWFDSETPDPRPWPACDYCGLPSVCFGADLANPRHRCPRCCRAHRQFGGLHGPDDYLAGHIAAEGLHLPTEGVSR